MTVPPCIVPNRIHPAVSLVWILAAPTACSTCCAVPPPPSRLCHCCLPCTHVEVDATCCCLRTNACNGWVIQWDYTCDQPFSVISTLSSRPSLPATLPPLSPILCQHTVPLPAPISTAWIDVHDTVIPVLSSISATTQCFQREYATRCTFRVHVSHTRHVTAPITMPKFVLCLTVMQ